MCEQWIESPHYFRELRWKHGINQQRQHRNNNLNKQSRLSRSMAVSPPTTAMESVRNFKKFLGVLIPWNFLEHRFLSTTQRNHNTKEKKLCTLFRLWFVSWLWNTLSNFCLFWLVGWCTCLGIPLPLCVCLLLLCLNCFHLIFVV